MLASPLTCIQLYFSIISSKLVLVEALRPSSSQCTFTCGLDGSPLVGCLSDFQYENELQVRSLGTDGRPLSQSRYRLDISAHLVKQNLSAKGQRRFAFFCCHPGGGALRNASPSAVCRNNTLSESLGESNYGELEQRIEAEPLQGCSL